MYAVVKLAGKQFKVSADQVLRVPYMGDDVGQSIEIKEVMAVGEGDELKLGSPFVDGASVKAEVLNHGQDRKILVFKKKRRKKYRRVQGHRQQFTELKITSIA